MTLDGFLTLLALLVAIYTLLRKHQQLSLCLGKKVQVLIAIIAFLLIIYIQFNEPTVRLCIEVVGDACERLPQFRESSALLTPPQWSFLIVFIWVIIFGIVHHSFARRRSISSLPTISRMVDDLIYERNYAELVDLVEPRLPTISKAANRSLYLQKLHDKITSTKEGSDFLDETPTPQCITKIRRTLAHLIPEQNRTQKTAKEILYALCQSEDLTNYIVNVKPYFALSLLPPRQFSETYQFSNAYFRGLILNTGSILYQELKSESNFSPGTRLPREDSRLLNFLFRDASVAQKLGVYKPIGDCMMELVRPHESPMPEFTQTLNKKSGYVRAEAEDWTNPIFIGTRFFEYMVTFAAKQEIKDHMSLYYFTDIIECLEKIYDTSAPEINESDEFPTISAKLIYELIDVLNGWILLAQKLPEDSPHMESTVLNQCKDLDSTPEAYTDFFDNGNIPVSAANTLGFCMKKIVLSQRIGESFKRYVYRSIIHVILKWELENCWRSLVVLCVVHAGSGSLCDEYRKALNKIHSEIEVDLGFHKDVSDLKEELERAYGQE